MCGLGSSKQIAGDPQALSWDDWVRLCSTCRYVAPPRAERPTWNTDPVGLLRPWLEDLSETRRRAVINELRAVGTVIAGHLDDLDAEMALNALSA